MRNRVQCPGTVGGLRSACLGLSGLGLVFALLVMAACGGGSPERERTRAATLNNSNNNSGNAPEERPRVERDVPSIFRGTIGAEAIITGVEPVLVSGYGLVVGLDGTGGGPLPDGIAATMEREMGLRGVGRADRSGSAMAEKSPREVLRDPNVAVVMVQAAIPPGSPEGASFDVYVRAVNATSLEGGTLWTTDLRLGPPTVFGGYRTQKLAQARGPIFINPFAEPGKEDDGVSRDQGRILDGGVADSPLRLELALDNPSHTRARAMVSAINSRFPRGNDDRGDTARGRDGSSVTLRVPAAYRDRPRDFLQIVRHLRTDPRFPEEYARRYIEALQDQPELADSLSWSLVALGRPAVPFVRRLYDDSELVPRMTALRVGAMLNDVRAAEPLIEMASEGSTTTRTEAISLLGRIDAGPNVDRALQDLLEERELLVRIAAYEALAKRAERAQFRRLASDERVRQSARSETHLQRIARLRLPSSSLQGIERRPVQGKFLLDIVPHGEPLIYITQQGEPRIVIFGESPALKIPLFVSTWSDRLMLAADEPGEPIRVYYRDRRTRESLTEQVRGDLTDLILFMAHEPSPERPSPGLALSYSEVVGALHAIHREGGTEAGFVTERDRLLAAISEATRGREVRDRPETPDDDPGYRDIDPTEIPGFERPGEDFTPRIIRLREAPDGEDNEDENEDEN